MKARDRRAILLLGLWGLSLGLFWGVQRGMAWRRTWALRRAELNSMYLRKGRLLVEEAALVKQRDATLAGIPRMSGEMGEDQLRLRGQQALLSAGERAGLKGLRLRPEGAESQGSMMVFRWVLDGEGSLTQWVGGLQALEGSLPLMHLQTLRLDLVGDPWALDVSGNAEGPPLRGAVLCSWMVVKS